MKKIEAYKAFNSDMTCRGFKFEIGKEYTQDGKIVVCENGFHACKNPLDVLCYYDIIDEKGQISRFAKVTQTGDISKCDNKTCSAKIKIEAELTLPDFINEAVNYITRSVKSKSSGDYTQQASSGDYTKQASSGDCTQQASSGDDTKQASSGDYTKHKLEGKNSVAVACGKDSMVCGVSGTLVCLCLYKQTEDGKTVPHKLVTGVIGKDGLKDNVWYKLNDRGKFVKAE